MFRQKWTQACCCVLLFTVIEAQPVLAISLHDPSDSVIHTYSSVTTAARPSTKSVPRQSTKRVSPQKSGTSSQPNSGTTASSRAQTQPSRPTVSADAAVLMDAATGDVLFDKQGHKKRPPASTTKMMTAILALELGRPDEVVTVSPKAAAVGESTIHLDPGEKATLYELVTGALIKSGNDACVAIAEQIAGSEEEFIRLMNKKALALGAKDTHFENPHGLPNKNHYSTAYDLALIARYGLQLPAFASITRQKETEIHFLEPDFIMDLRNTNKLLWSYPYADGVKTGTTNAAGKCLVASATKNGRQLIAVLLHAPNRFGDAQKLLEWGFEQTETVQVVKAGEVVTEFPLPAATPLPAIARDSLEVSIAKSDREKIEKKVQWTRTRDLPIQAGEELGVYEVWFNGRKLKSVPLLAEHEVKKLRGFLSSS